MDTYSMVRVETVIPDVQKFVNIRYSWYQLRLIKEKNMEWCIIYP